MQDVLIKSSCSVTKKLSVFVLLDQSVEMNVMTRLQKAEQGKERSSLSIYNKEMLFPDLCVFVPIGQHAFLNRINPVFLTPTRTPCQEWVALIDREHGSDGQRLHVGVITEQPC